MDSDLELTQPPSPFLLRGFPLELPSILSLRPSATLRSLRFNFLNAARYRRLTRIRGFNAEPAESQRAAENS